MLGARGYEVVVSERNEWLGGKAAVLETNGFRFDKGPTILTLPAVLDRIFAEAGRHAAGTLDLVRLDPQWRSFFEDGSTLDLLADTDAMASGLAAFSAGTGTAEGYRLFIGHSEQLHRISESYFFWRPVGGLRDMFDARATFQTNILRDVLAMRPGHSVAGTVRGRIPDPRVAQMVDHFTQYVGPAPDASPAVLCGIAHMQTCGGVWYPCGRDAHRSGGTDEACRISQRYGFFKQLGFYGVERKSARGAMTFLRTTFEALRALFRAIDAAIADAQQLDPV